MFVNKLIYELILITILLFWWNVLFSIKNMDLYSKNAGNLKIIKVKRAIYFNYRKRLT
jgi:hypothetical protein